MTTHTVALEDGTVGTLESDIPEYMLIGLEVTVDLRDENGMPIKATGKIFEVLEESRPLSMLE